LNSVSKSIKGSKILLLGVAYKPNIDDERESPALEIIDILNKKGSITSYNDPHIPQIQTPNGCNLFSTDISPDILSTYDLIVIATDHSTYNQSMILNNSNLIVDLRNFISIKSEKVFKL